MPDLLSRITELYHNSRFGSQAGFRVWNYSLQAGRSGKRLLDAADILITENLTRRMKKGV